MTTVLYKCVYLKTEASSVNCMRDSKAYHNSHHLCMQIYMHSNFKDSAHMTIQKKLDAVLEEGSCMDCTGT